jgi:chaperonin GroES
MIEGGRPVSLNAYKVHWFLTDMMFSRIMVHTYKKTRGRKLPMKLRPLHDWTVIRPSEAEDVTAGGLYIPDTAKDKPQEGVIESVGPGAYEEEKGKKKKDEKKERRFVPTTVRPGDRVIYERYAGQTYKIGSEERILVRERDILGILPEHQAPRPRPLQIPASTTGPSPSALVKSSPLSAEQPQRLAGRKKTAKKASSKTAPRKKVVKKTVKKRAVKSKKAPVKRGRKSKAKKSAAKKTKKKK